MGEVEVALREGRLKLNKLTEMVVAQKEAVASLSGRTDAPSRHWKALQAVLLLLRKAPDTCDLWEKCREAVCNEEFIGSLEGCDTSVPRDVLMVQSSEAIKASIEGIDLKNIERTHVPISMLLEWAQQALVVHDAAVEVR